jgi:hypothetical protein
MYGNMNANLTLGKPELIRRDLPASARRVDASIGSIGRPAAIK